MAERRPPIDLALYQGKVPGRGNKKKPHPRRLIQDAGLRIHRAGEDIAFDMAVPGKKWKSEHTVKEIEKDTTLIKKLLGSVSECLDHLGSLCEGKQTAVTFDMDEYPEDLKAYIENLWPDGNDDWWNDVGAPEMAGILKETKKLQRKNVAEILKAVRRIEGWGGTKITVKPSYNWDRSRKYDPFEDMLEPVDSSVVHLWPKTSGNEDAFFSFWPPKTVEDVLEARDTDFFPPGEEVLESDYFSLVAELKNPGASRRPGKKLTLYTARPSKDRSQYQGAKKLPAGLFLTNSMSRAEGIAVDLKGGKTRDLWAVAIDSRYLHQTLDTGLVRDYQLVREAPVRSMRLIQPDIG